MDYSNSSHETPKCRICTISSECFNYFNIFEKKIFNNIIIKDAVTLITQLQISGDDGYPKWICCRCEQRLLDAYQFRKLAESSANQFSTAAILQTNNRRVQIIKSENYMISHQQQAKLMEKNDVATDGNSEDEVVDMIVYCKSNENDSEQHNFNIVTGEDEELVDVEYLNDSHDKPDRSESISPFSGFDDQSVNKYEYNINHQQKNHHENSNNSTNANVNEDFNNVEVVSIHDDDNNVGFEITVMSTESSNNKQAPRFYKKKPKQETILLPRLSNRAATIKKRTPTKIKNIENDMGVNKLPMQRCEEIQSVTVSPKYTSQEINNRVASPGLVTGEKLDDVEYLIQKVEEQDGIFVRKSLKNDKFPKTKTPPTKKPEIIKNNSDSTEIEPIDPKRKYSCQVCAKRFVGKSNLIDHLRYHANVKPFKCDMCDRAFVQIGTLKSHMRTHTKEKPFVCHICQRAFSQNCSLKIHLRKHTRERNYVCQVCEKAFMSHCDLAKHSRIHDPSKHYPCPYCLKKFTQNCNLKKHMKSMHKVGGDDGGSPEAETSQKKKKSSVKMEINN